MQGRSVIYISHRFTEISELCDSATVLRDGATVGDLPIEPGVEERIVEMMLGAAIEPGQARKARAAPRSDARRPAPAGPQPVRGQPSCQRCLLRPAPGEVLGVVALEGQGQDELFDVLAGFRRADRRQYRGGRRSP